MANLEENIYPLTVVADRYCGTYSGGAYLAFKMFPWRLPEEPFSDDIECSEWWDTHKNFLVGKGESVSTAVADLSNKLKEASENGYF